MVGLPTIPFVAAGYIDNTTNISEVKKLSPTGVFSLTCRFGIISLTTERQSPREELCNAHQTGVKIIW